MCLIVHKPKGIKVPKDVMQGALQLNEDGYGIMYSKDNSLIVEKSLDPKWLQERLADLKDQTVVIHLRMRTHGNIDLENTHPFFVTEDIAVVHNGILTDYGYAKDRSDTRMFIDQILTPLLGKSPELFGSKALQTVLEETIGKDNKMVLMRSDGEVWMLNGDQGLTYNKVWLSNTYAWKPAVIGWVTKTTAMPEKADDHDAWVEYWEKQIDNKTVSNYAGAVSSEKVWEKANYTSGKDTWDDADYYEHPNRSGSLSCEDLFWLEYDDLYDLIEQRPDVVTDLIYECDVPLFNVKVKTA